jgi:pSer/pThr/pTyr-binding forkhead associated (FHA) protein/V8-like Glu-specific endopeptidase
VKVQIRVLSGALTGRTLVLSRPSIEIGRHPSSHLQFDPDVDRAVSARHATLIREGDRWFIQDRGSLNGTLVNGHRLVGRTPLEDTDHIRFGSDGPSVEFRLVPETVPDGEREPEAYAEKPQDGARQPLRGAAGPKVAAQRSRRPATEAGVTERVRVEVNRQTRRLRALTISLVAVVLLVTAVFVYDSARQRRLREREVESIEAQSDSILLAAGDAMQAIEGQMAGLQAALTASQDEVEQLKGALAGASQSGSAEEVQRAVALIWVEFDPGEVYVGTAFAVRADGVLITSRHVVAGEEGDRRPGRIAVKFADSDQVYRGRLLAVSHAADVAALKVDIPGGVPTVRSLNLRADTLDQGDPVAIIGFPLGPDLPMTSLGQDRTVARTSFSAGSVSKIIGDVVQVDGYGAEGSSGSPIFDRNGAVIGVVYGGEPGSYGRVVLGVPSRHVAALLERIEP